MMYDTNKECKAVIARLRAICKIKGIRLNKLAKKANLSPSTLSYILNGKTQPQIYTLLQLCNALEIKIDDLFSKIGDKDRREDSAQDTVIDTSESRIALQESDITLKSLSRDVLSDEEKKLVVHYRYFPDEKKKLLKIYIDMLQQYETDRK